MTIYVYFNSLIKHHVILKSIPYEAGYSLIFSYDNTLHCANEEELICVLDYVRSRYSSSVIPSTIPSIQTINNIFSIFPLIFSIMTLLPLSLDPSLNRVFYPFSNIFTVFYDNVNETYGVSSSPYFSDNRILSIVSVIENLDQKTDFKLLVATINLIKLGIHPDFLLPQNVVSQQISLFPELFAI